MVASAIFCLDAGMRTSSCIAVLALRMRVNMSAMGSVIMMRSPTRLGHAWDLAGVRHAAQPDTAQAELSVPRPRPAALAAAVVAAHLVLRLGIRFVDQ